jgi:peptide deformylase
MGQAGIARPITCHGAPVLHRPCAPVTVFGTGLRFGDDLRALIADLYASMYAANGVGLAANQIGVDARVFVVDCPSGAPGSPDGERVVAHVVNPVLHLPPGPCRLEVGRECCLSIPGAVAQVHRSSAATVTGVDQDGAAVWIDGHGLLARCLQHELDHLDGVLYVDRLSIAQRRAVLAEAFEPGNC